MKLRSQLVLLALVALLPVAILAAVLGAFLIEQQRDTFRQGTEARVHALLTAVDAELNGSIDVLRALANVRSLDDGDLKLFRESAGQILKAQANWTNINLARPDGQQIVNLRIPEGSSLPKLPANDKSIDEIRSTLKPAVGDLLVGPVTNQWDFAVRVPVIREGKIQYILSAVVNPASIGRLMASQDLPADWEGMVLDRNARIVSRSVDAASLGQFASEGLREALAASSRGWYRGTNLEGIPKYRAYRRSEATGWTFAMAIPTAAVDTTATRATWVFGLALAGTIAIAYALARSIGRRIAQPITDLAVTTDRLARGENVEIGTAAQLPELRSLEAALRQAAGTQLALKQAEERARSSETHLRMALIAGRAGTWEWDLATDTVRWSREVEAIHGLPAGSFVGTLDGYRKDIHPQDREKVEAAIAQLREAKDHHIEYRVVRPDGSVRWIERRGKVFEDAGGRPTRVVGVCTDITERKVTEQALREADRHKDEFLAMLSHELRNPLAAITTAAHVLRSAAPTDATTARAQGVIDRQTQHMVRLIEDLLDITRVRLGKLSLTREPVELAALVSDATQSKRDAGALKDRAAVHLDLAPVWVNGDRARLEQIYLNLLDNALKFTRASGSIRVSLRQEGDEAALRVSDDGQGIAAEMLPKVFDLFVQGEQNLDRSQGGLGLGLALVRRLAELHDGSVTAASGGVGRGAIFSVAIPAIPAPRELPRKVPLIREPGAERLRVLVIEDNQDARQMLRAVLSMEGHKVREAANGESGIAAAHEMKPNVVLLDIGLPDMDGYEVARRLRTTAGGYSMVLIALSGYGRADDRGRDSSFDAQVVKPTSPEQLAQLMAELVAARNGVNA